MTDGVLFLLSGVSVKGLKDPYRQKRIPQLLTAESGGGLLDGKGRLSISDEPRRRNSKNACRQGWIMLEQFNQFGGFRRPRGKKPKGIARHLRKGGQGIQLTDDHLDLTGCGKFAGRRMHPWTLPPDCFKPEPVGRFFR